MPETYINIKDHIIEISLPFFLISLMPLQTWIFAMRYVESYLIATGRGIYFMAIRITCFVVVLLYTAIIFTSVYLSQKNYVLSEIN